MPVVRPPRRGDLAQLAAIYDHYAEHSVATFDTESGLAENRVAWLETFSDIGPSGCSWPPMLTGFSDLHRAAATAPIPPSRRRSNLASTSIPGSAQRASARFRTAPLLDDLRSETLHLAVAGIALPNDASVALHRKFAFTEVGNFDEYAIKRGVYISSLRMQRRF